MASSRCSVPVVPGRICPAVTVALSPAGDGCGSGKKKGSGKGLGGRCWRAWTNRAGWLGNGPFWTARLWRQKRGEAVGLVKRGQGSKVMVLVDGQGLPLGTMGASAQEAEVHLAEATVETVRVPWRRGRPRKRVREWVADRAYDSDRLRGWLRRRGIRPCIPRRRNRRQRGRPPELSGYRQRWIVERTVGWLGNYRRLVVRSMHLFGICSRLLSMSQVGSAFRNSSTPASVTFVPVRSSPSAGSSVRPVPSAPRPLPPYRPNSMLADS
jgi:transposase